MELELQMAYDLSSIPKVRVVVASLALGASTLVGIAGYESYRSEAYLPTKYDVPTIGYGTTKGVKMGDRTTPERALKRFATELDEVYVAGVKRCVKVPLYDYEFGAYISLAQNIGLGAFCRKAKPGKPPNLIDLINAQRYDEACTRISAFNKQSTGKVDEDGNKIMIELAGLTKRRAEERRICEGKEFH